MLMLNCSRHTEILMGVTGHRLVKAGHSVLFAPAYRLMQELPRLQARPGPAPPAAQAEQQVKLHDLSSKAKRP